MIIVLKPGSTAAQVAHVIERIKELGLRPHVSRGKRRTIIGVIGDEDKISLQPLEAIIVAPQGPGQFAGLGPAIFHLGIHAPGDVAA